METLKEAATKVGNKVAQVKGGSTPSAKEDAHHKPTQFVESDKVETAGRPGLTDAYGTHSKEQASSLISNLEKLGNKPTDN